MAASLNILFTKLFAFLIFGSVRKLTVRMRLNRNQYRAIYAALVIIAFFVPAYSNISAFQFLFLAIGAVGADNEITPVDLLVVLVPLLFIPLAAIIVLIKAMKKKPLNSLLLGLPFFSIAFFFLIMSFDMNRQSNAGGMFGLFREMSIGFYIAAAASLLLLLSNNRRESLKI